MNDVTLLIGGKAVSKNGRFFHRIDPMKGTPASRAAAAEASDVDAAVCAAAEAFPGWAATGPGRRRELLRTRQMSCSRMRVPAFQRLTTQTLKAANLTEPESEEI